MNKKIFLLASLLVFAAGCSDDSDNTNAVCGNLAVEDGEKCDDGNTVADDGCAADCKSVEDGYTCPENGGACSKNDGPITEPVAVCGDGKVGDGEKCDDGNKVSGDGCAADCKSVEDGYTCPENGGKCSKIEDSVAVCGNGKLEDGEQCDDGNAVSGDGCADDCKSVEEGFHCDAPGQLCTADTCGDEKVDAGEDCDNGLMNTDYGIEGDCSESCHPAHFCGDAKHDQIDIDNGEECDDGKENNTGGYGKCKNDCKRDAYCGDGKIQSEYEQCDDGNSTDGDGCSADCKMEPGFSCLIQDGKSICSSILCGNGKIDQNTAELCDDGNRESGDGCSGSCQPERGFRCTTDENGKSSCEKTCGNGNLDADVGEQCDDNNNNDGDGCSSQCTIEPGYICNEKGCFARACGDGIIAGSEECDDGNTDSKDGCSKFCQREENWHCDVAGNPCAKDICGDGIVTGDETCDEGHIDNPANKTAGCVDCRVQLGWKCETAGASCVAAECGNGILEGAETCEEQNECCNGCVIQPFCKCDDQGKNCQKGACGNGILEAGEQCDDGNDKAGDGCGPDCRIEAIFTCNNGVCKPTCGDGITLIEAGEECDDGNLTNGDGCSSDCKREEGYTCTDFTQSNPPSINIPITYRDFRSWGDGVYPGTGTKNGYLSQELFDTLPPECLQSSGYRKDYFPAVNKPIPDFESYCVDQYCQNTLYEDLDKDGKPVLRPGSEFTLHPDYIDKSYHKDTLGLSYTCQPVFAWWYRDVEGLNISIKTHLTLTQNANDPELYEYGSKNFFPILNQGFHAPDMNPRASNSGKYTSEFETYFKYKGGETLVFDGDDDAWVFINNKLAVDMGCMHVSYRSPVTLDDEMAKKLNIYPGGIYPIKMFHAERCSNGTSGSIYQVSLRGFINMGTSQCWTTCGDGIVRGNEECDYVGIDKNVELQHEKGCSADCKLQPYCGNGKIEAGEECDSTAEWCVNCKIAGDTCGNGVKDAHEECDGTDGIAEGQVCLPTCRISGCGDGYVDEKNGEQCDDGNKSDDDMCTSKCTEPKCGDGIVTPFLGEVCDDGPEGNDGAYGHCGIGCTYRAPYCGDGVVDANYEQCDDGAENNIGGYGKCNPDCTFDIRCGDGIVQPEFEQCDDPNNASCSKSCTWVIN